MALELRGDPMDPMKTHGAFSWCELMTPDTKAAAHFYHQLFGWNLQTLDMPGGPYHVVKLGDTAIAGIMSMPADGSPKMPPHWGCYITVDNADESAAEAQALGAKVIVAPTDVPGVGRFAVLQDPQGAVFSIIDYLDD
jgi:predicted enzyme related to lactoylglutathione lyase